MVEFGGPPECWPRGEAAGGDVEDAEGPGMQGERTVGGRRAGGKALVRPGAAAGGSRVRSRPEHRRWQAAPGRRARRCTGFLRAPGLRARSWGLV